MPIKVYVKFSMHLSLWHKYEARGTGWITHAIFYSCSKTAMLVIKPVKMCIHTSMRCVCMIYLLSYFSLDILLYYIVIHYVTHIMQHNNERCSSKYRGNEKRNLCGQMKELFFLHSLKQLSMFCSILRVCFKVSNMCSPVRFSSRNRKWRGAAHQPLKVVPHNHVNSARAITFLSKTKQ